ncbi:MAG: 16S rRNA (cytosine(1402)-N(4))-methyltransferase RsmH [Oscillospiraceae bacterium]|jgi:16S rRNA (cytosine1402-N4)-methyltransferase|nr:16S rRNA (cytosine(1402)-N(4))-methyltransferase RsmH [Oscillospiraceae bacterium]
MDKRHTPVILEKSIEGLNITAGGIYVDGTLGLGGHSKEIAKRLTTGKLIAIDCDKTAIKIAKDNLKEFENKIIYVHGNFAEIAEILAGYKINKVDGMIFDLGVSSPQLDNKERGFSYNQNSDLDMRMDQDSEQTAYNIVNNYDEKELQNILFGYGEEKYTKLIVKEIIKKRQRTPIKTTYELNEIIKSSIPAYARHEAQHPSKRTFQAIRIAVNNELEALEKMLTEAPDLLYKHGRLCIISFHSLEDRIVKKEFVRLAKNCECPKDFPICTCDKKATFKIINRKPITANEDEIKQNPRARSAKLRIAEKL